MTTNEKYLELQQDMYSKISSLSNLKISKRDVLCVIEEVFSAHKYNFIEKDGDEVMNRKELLQGGLEQQLLNSEDYRIPACFKLLSDYLNEIMYGKESYLFMQKELDTPVKDELLILAKSAIRYAKQGTHMGAFSEAVRILKECNFSPSYNECVLLKDIVATYTKSANVNLDRVSFDYNLFEISKEQNADSYLQER